jgi:hypothetical protein
MAYPAGAAVAPPASQGMSGCAKAAIVIAVLALLLGGGCVASLVIFADDIEDAANELEDNVNDARQNGRVDTDLVSCERGADGFMVAGIEITNQSSGRSRYFILVEFRADDRTTSIPGSDEVFGIEPGETVEIEIRSETAATEELECEITEAVRTADE